MGLRGFSIFSSLIPPHITVLSSFFTLPVLVLGFFTNTFWDLQENNLKPATATLIFILSHHSLLLLLLLLLLLYHHHHHPKLASYKCFSLRRRTMRARRSLEQEFLKRWVMGIKASKLPKKEMNLLERKKTIKLTADLAIASARNATTSWSCAVIAGAVANDERNETLINKLLDPEGSKRVQRFKSSRRSTSMTMSVCSSSSSSSSKRIMRSKKAWRRSCCNNGGRAKKRFAAAKASCIAKQMVKKRTKMLKKLVPGGEEMDELAFLDEAIDYIVSLRAQVDVMRSLANASEAVSNRKII